MSERQQAKLERLKLLQKSLKKEYKNDSHVRLASDIPKSKRIMTGVMRFDALTGGGFVIGKQHMLSGWQGAGKTTMALMAARNAQRTCSACHSPIAPRLLVPPTNSIESAEKWKSKRLSCLSCGAPYHKDDRPPVTAGDYYINTMQLKKCPDGVNKSHLYCKECDSVDTIVPLDTEDEYVSVIGDLECGCPETEPMMVMFIDLERKLDLAWAEKIGVNLDAMWVEEVEYGEQSADVVRESIANGTVDFLIFDSIANVAPSDEIDKSASESDRPGERARLVNKLMRQLPTLTRKSINQYGVEPTILWINQVRETIGVSFGNPEVLPGGHGQKFAVTTWIHFTSNKSSTESITGVGRKTMNENMGVASFNELRLVCRKNGSGPTEGLRANLNLVTVNDGILRAGEINDYTLVYETGKATGVIYKDASIKRWKIIDWPLDYANEGDLKIDMHNKWWLKNHICKLSIERQMEDWNSLKVSLGKDVSSDE